MRNPDLQKLYDVISGYSASAYKNDNLLANNGLAKNIASVSQYEIFVSGSPIPKISAKVLLKNIFFGTVKNCVWFVNQVLAHLFFLFSGLRYQVNSADEELLLIDEFILPKKIVASKEFKDSDFPGLVELLKSKGRSYVYTPKFVPVNAWVFYKAFKVLKRAGIPVLTEFQVLRFADYLRLLIFVCTHAFYVIRLAKPIIGDTREKEFLRFILFDGLRQLTAIGYARFLYGRRLSQLPVSQVKCVSWYENQSIDKCFYKGLRHTRGKVFLVGAQFFIVPPDLLFMQPDENELDLGIVPDKVLVSGPYNVPKNTKINYHVGPPLRYAKIFSTTTNSSQSDTILVLLPYWEAEIKAIFNLIRGAQLNRKILVKFHPETHKKQYLKMLESNMKVTEKGIYDLFQDTRLVLGSCTGAQVEACCLGIPVISLQANQMFSINYLPDIGEGVLWKRVSSALELTKAVSNFENKLQNDSLGMSNAADKMRGMIFSEISGQKIIEAFDLA